MASRLVRHCRSKPTLLHALAQTVLPFPMGRVSRPGPTVSTALLRERLSPWFRHSSQTPKAVSLRCAQSELVDYQSLPRVSCEPLWTLKSTPSLSPQRSKARSSALGRHSLAQQAAIRSCFLWIVSPALVGTAGTVRWLQHTTPQSSLRRWPTR